MEIQKSYFLKPRGLRALLILLLLLPGSLLATWAVLYSQNSLYLNDQWWLQKQRLQMTVMGSYDFLLSRIPLAGNVLDLGKYYGFQEVSLKNPNPLREISFHFKMDDQAYLDITYSQQGISWKALRLSRRVDLPSAEIQGSESQFLKITSVQMPALTTGWHEVHLKNEGAQLTLNLDGKTISLSKEAGLIDSVLKFHNGRNTVLIDKVVTTDFNGIKKSYSFGNSKQAEALLLLNLSLALLAGFLFSRITLGKFVFLGTKALLPWILCSLLGIVSFGSWDLFDFFYYSHQIPADNGITRLLNGEKGSWSSERIRNDFFQSWYLAAGVPFVNYEGLLKRGYPNNPLSSGPYICGLKNESCVFVDSRKSLTESPRTQKLYRILFVGTSQTEGAGAETLDQTFFAQTYHQLRKSLSDDIALEFINISVSGSISKRLLEDYKAHYLSLKPDLVLINLSGNDWNAQDFEQSLHEFAAKNRDLSIRTLFMTEPSSSESNELPFLSKNHEILESVARHEGVTVYPLASQMDEWEKAHNGYIWWDMIHLTNYGQNLVSTWLAPQLLQELKSLPAKNRARLDVP